MLNEILTLQSLNLSLAYPFLFLLGIAIVLLLCSAFLSLHKSFYEAISALSLLVSFFMIFFNVNEQGLGQKAFFGTLHLDLIAFYSSCIVLLFSLLYILMKRWGESGEFYSLYLFIIASFLLMVSSSNLVIIFIGLEASSLALYTLIAMKGTQNAISSAIKYFSTAMIASSFFVLASAFIYAKTGSLSLNYIVAQNDKDIFLLSAGVLLFILLGVKLSLVPFHFWLKDVYFASNANLIAFISVVPKIAVIAVTMRVFVFFQNSGFESVMLILVSFSMIAAALCAISQSDIKKMFAYSSVVHSSFIIAALIPFLTPFRSNLDLSETSLIPIFVYWLLFGFANYAIFLILSSFERSNYESLRGLFRKKAIKALCVGVCVLSLAGIPPFGVFWGKVIVLFATLSSGYYILALLVAFSSVLMLYAYLKIIIYSFFMPGEFGSFKRLNFRQNVILCLCVLMGLFAVLFMV